jgi:biopolymer transport protein ExbB
MDRLIELIQSGGFVMPPLVLAAAVLWYALGIRFSLLKKSPHQIWSSIKEEDLEGSLGDYLKVTKELMNSAIEKSLMRSTLEEKLVLMKKKLSIHGTLVTTIVMIAPLLGLLGTVTGMIETFDSLGDNSLFAQGGGIAGGIGQALLTTQMGLIVAIPGHLIGKYLKRKETEIMLQAEHILEWGLANKGVSHAK